MRHNLGPIRKAARHRHLAHSNETLADRLRHDINRGLTYKQIAAALGVSRHTVRNWIAAEGIKPRRTAA